MRVTQVDQMLHYTTREIYDNGTKVSSYHNKTRVSFVKNKTSLKLFFMPGAFKVELNDSFFDIALTRKDGKTFQSLSPLPQL